MNLSPKRFPRVWVQVDRSLAIALGVLSVWALVDTHLAVEEQAIFSAQAWLLITAAIVCVLADSIILWRPRAALFWPGASSTVLLAVWFAEHYLSGLMLPTTLGVHVNLTRLVRLVGGAMRSLVDPGSMIILVCGVIFRFFYHRAFTTLRAKMRKAVKLLAMMGSQPNQSLEPMARCVTPRARHESRRLSPWLTI